MRFVTLACALWCGLASAECANDNDCKGNRICEAGSCVFAPESSSTVTTPPPTPTRYGSVFVDPLGFLSFGPTFGVEAGAGRFTGTIYGRWFSAGLLSSVLVLGPSEKYDFSFGVGLRGRIYFRDGFAGAHVGFGAEFVRTQIENGSYRLVISTNLVVPQVEGGYRWAAWGRFYVGLAGSVGYAVRFGWRTDNLPGGDSAATLIPPDPSAFFFSAKLEIGFLF